MFPDLLIDGSVVEMVSELKILGVILDSKLTFEKQVRAIAASASMRVVILRKIMSVFRDVAIVAKCFCRAFILPVLEYCSPVWMPAATSHLSLLDRVVSQVSQLSGGSVSCDLWHRRKVASLSAFFKIDSLVDHPVRGLFSAQYVLRRPTRGALAAHSRSFEMPRSRTVQFSRSFVLSCVRLWNGLHEAVFAGEVFFFKLQSFAFFYKVDCPLFLPFLQLFLFHFSFSRDKRYHGGLRTYRLFCLYSCCFWSCLPWGWFSR